MLNLDTVTYDIERWMATFVEVPHPALGGWAPCPYARKVRLEGELEVKHKSFNQFVAGDIQHALFRDWPDQF